MPAVRSRQCSRRRDLYCLFRTRGGSHRAGCSALPAEEDTDAGQRKGAGGCSFLRHEHVGADDKGHKGGDDRADRKDFPVALIDEHAKEFLKVDPDLVDPSGILQIFS